MEWFIPMMKSQWSFYLKCCVPCNYVRYIFVVTDRSNPQCSDWNEIKSHCELWLFWYLLQPVEILTDNLRFLKMNFNCGQREIYCYSVRHSWCMMTSSNGTIFLVSGLFWIWCYWLHGIIFRPEMALSSDNDNVRSLRQLYVYFNLNCCYGICLNRDKIYQILPVLKAFLLNVTCFVQAIALYRTCDMPSS